MKELINAWNCNMRLKHAVKYLDKKGLSKATVVKFYRDTCKKYGYSGSIPIPRIRTPKSLAFSYSPSVELSDGVWYCEERNLWWKDGTVYCQDSAAHNGLIGYGAQMKEMCKRL